VRSTEGLPFSAQLLFAGLCAACPSKPMAMGPHQLRTRNDLTKTQRTQSNPNWNAAISTKLTIVLPLITVWLQVRVLPGFLILL
jgi:hypothetical protein